MHFVVLRSFVAVVLTAVVSTPVFSAGVSQLNCELKGEKYDYLTSGFYDHTVRFTQSRVTAIRMFVEKSYSLSSARWVSAEIDYLVREKETLRDVPRTEVVKVDASLRKDVAVKFYSFGYGDSAELRWVMSVDPEKASFGENGEIQFQAPGFQVFIESYDPYHKDPYEESLTCLGPKAK